MQLVIRLFPFEQYYISYIIKEYRISIIEACTNTGNVIAIIKAAFSPAIIITCIRIASLKVPLDLNTNIYTSAYVNKIFLCSEVHSNVPVFLHENLSKSQKPLRGGR
jgi:hypothetical protein